MRPVGGQLLSIDTAVCRPYISRAGLANARPAWGVYGVQRWCVSHYSDSALGLWA